MPTFESNQQNMLSVSLLNEYDINILDTRCFPVIQTMEMCDYIFKYLKIISLHFK